MPIVELHIQSGYDEADKGRLSEALIDAVRLTLPAAREAAVVNIQAEGATELADDDPNPASQQNAPDEIVRTYLANMEARDLSAAKACLADGFSMHFPGAEPMTRLEELLEWAAPRYRSITKSYFGFETLKGSDGEAVVFCRGTLAGEWPDGSRFESIRFIDRFEITHGKIARQDVWNDIAETRQTA